VTLTALPAPVSPSLPVRALVAAGMAGDMEVSTFTFVINAPVCVCVCVCVCVMFYFYFYIHILYIVV